MSKLELEKKLRYLEHRNKVRPMVLDKETEQMVPGPERYVEDRKALKEALAKLSDTESFPEAVESVLEEENLHDEYKEDFNSED